MPTPLSAEAKALIDRPNFAHLATLMADGSPQSVPVWVGREGDRLLVCTGEGSLKGRNTRRDPRVAVSIVDQTSSHKYTGKPFPMRAPRAAWRWWSRSTGCATPSCPSRTRRRGSSLWSMATRLPCIETTGTFS